MNFSAAILAGGKNSRFNGEQKSFLKIDDQYIIDRTIGVLKNIFDEIIIISNQPELYKDYSNYKIVGDFYKEIGPLGGIHAALQTAKNDAVFIVSCDMPFINESLIKEQILSHLNAESDITIPIHNGHIEPLHCIFNKEIIDVLGNYIKTSNSLNIRGLFNSLKVNYFNVPDDKKYSKSFTNINHPDDFLLLQKQNE